MGSSAGARAGEHEELNDEKGMDKRMGGGEQRAPAHWIGREFVQGGGRRADRAGGLGMYGQRTVTWRCAAQRVREGGVFLVAVAAYTTTALYSSTRDGTKTRKDAAYFFFFFCL